MAKNLMIVESPAKARTISKFLGPDFRIMASMGHVRDLPKKAFGVNIRKNFKPRYVIPYKSRKVVSQLKKAYQNARDLYLATDFDREGEAIAWHVVEVIKPKVDPKRITFHEITKDAISKALKKPRGIDPDLVEAQQARRILDRIVGYKLSPFLWKKVASGLSAGRVQSAAVRLVVDREKEITDFKPQEYWIVAVDLAKKIKPKNIFRAFLSKIKNKKIEKTDIKNEKSAKKIVKDLEGAQYIVKNIERKIISRFPAPPFTTSTLQQEAARKLGFSAKKTMMIAQQLYEGINLSGRGRLGLITYMRTDSVSIAMSALKKAAKIISQKFGPEYALSIPRIFKTKSKHAQEAHEAIRPTYFELEPEKIQKDLNEDQFKLYDLIWKRAIASQMREARIRVINVDIKAKDYTFVARGENIISSGFIQVYTEGQDEGPEWAENILPPLKINERLNLKKLITEQKFTEPPARYTEATLVKALEQNGIGRPSTYAPTLATIQERGYVTRRGKYLYPEEIGILVNNLLKKHFSDIVDIRFTAKMEKELDDIAEGKLSREKILADFYYPFMANLNRKHQINKEDIVNEKTEEKCEKCGKPMVVKFGRFGKFLSCSRYPKCKYSRPVIDTGSKKANEKIEKKIEDQKCKKCGADMVVKEGPYGAFLACLRYPKCKFTKPILKKIGIPCPECKKGAVIERRTKAGKIFWGCSRYPTCRFASWTNPKEEKKLKEKIEKVKSNK